MATAPSTVRTNVFWGTCQVQHGLGYSKVHKKEQTPQGTLDTPTAPSCSQCLRVLITVRWIKPHLHSPFCLKARSNLFSLECLFLNSTLQMNRRMQMRLPENTSLLFFQSDTHSDAFKTLPFLQTMALLFHL